MSQYPLFAVFDVGKYVPFIAIAVLLLLAVILFKSMWRVAEPDEALIISGTKKGDGALGFRVVSGSGTLVIPGVQTVRPLSLNLRSTDLNVACVTSQGIEVVIKGVVIFKIGDSDELISNAARRFLGQEDQMLGQVHSVFSGHLRSIIGSMTVEEIISQRQKLTEETRAASGEEMVKLGLIIDSLQIDKVDDPTKYIENLAAPHIARVKMEARIQQAASDRQASEREAEAAALTAAARRASDIKQAEYRAEVERANATASQAGPLAEATARQQVIEMETQVATREASLTEARLNATVRKDADAEAYRITTEADARKKATIADAEASASSTREIGNAEAEANQARGTADAEVVKAKGQAEGAALEARAIGLAANQEAVIAQQLAERMPEIVAAAAKAFDNVDSMTVLDGADGVNNAMLSIITSVGASFAAARGVFDSNGTSTVKTGNGKVPVSAIPSTNTDKGVDNV